MNRFGDPEQWENEVHRVLNADQSTILKIALTARSLTAEDFLSAGYPKSHMSLIRHVRKLESDGILEHHGGICSYWSVTDYGRWRGKSA